MCNSHLHGSSLIERKGVVPELFMMKQGLLASCSALLRPLVKLEARNMPNVTDFSITAI